MNRNPVKTRVSRSSRRSAVVAALAVFALASQTPVRSQQPTVVGCGSVISAPGHYVLGADETCSGDGVTIAASSVRLNLAGFTLTGPGNPSAGETAGVLANDVSDVHITDGALVAFEDGIDMENVSKVRISNVRVSGSTHAGMVLNNFDDSTITRCDASNNFAQGIGIGEDSSDNDVIDNTTSFNGTDGVTFFGSSNDRNRIIGNTASGNGESGIDPSIGTDQLVQGNTVTGNENGIFVHFGIAAKVVGNVATGNATGIRVGRGTPGSHIQGNLVLGNGNDDMADENLPSCVNTWKGNTFETDSEGDGPGAGCIR